MATGPGTNEHSSHRTGGSPTGISPSPLADISGVSRPNGLGSDAEQPSAVKPGQINSTSPGGEDAKVGDPRLDYHQNLEALVASSNLPIDLSGHSPDEFSRDGISGASIDPKLHKFVEPDHHYSLSDVQEVRVAAKLATKFIDGKKTPDDLRGRLTLEGKKAKGFSPGLALPDGPYKGLPRSAKAAETGLLLSIDAQPKEAVMAGMMYEAFRVRLDSRRLQPAENKEARITPAQINQEIEDMKQVIRTKFKDMPSSKGPEVALGQEIVRHIERGMDFIERVAAVNSTASSSDTLAETSKLASLVSEYQDIAPLCCALVVAELASGSQSVPLTTSKVTNLERAFEEFGVSNALRVELLREAKLAFKDPEYKYTPEELHPELNSLGEEVNVRQVMSSNRFMAQHFGLKPRKWGEHEKLPFSRHKSEVGLILALAGADSDLVAAGVTHDFLEGYVDSAAEAMRRDLAAVAGERVVELVAGVTEPPKSLQQGNWEERKLAVLQSVTEGGQDIATLSAATKSSTLAEGNKYILDRYDSQGFPHTKGWSGGSIEQNVEMHLRYLIEYHNHRVSPLLCKLVGNEVMRMHSWVSAPKKAPDFDKIELNG